MAVRDSVIHVWFKITVQGGAKLSAEGQGPHMPSSSCLNSECAF